MAKTLLNMATGTYTGTGALLNVPLTFRPRAIEIIDTTTGLFVAKWNDQMAAASYLSSLDNGTAVRNSLVTTNGITGGSEGFQVGTDSHLNNSGDTYTYVAFG